ncbi:glycosyltransferase family 2 protein [Algoriphagus kandeliae]|uniref:Glycosyltransferase family 2 protein n=1 Tax=Algoriphagus kandeliae TaxID=2562278 RepID=A0A4Y9QVA4_9BACT|nr:glycosyltransferase family 2 protein [Algoriphagus kandeliae]TFV95688.1 glycosyltransferase family 2 protein [Algoriphagus kandeliae]
MPNPSVAIILVNWNGLIFTRACLKSLQSLDYTAFEIFVVDNGSENPEGAQLKEEFPHIHLLETGKNLGFSGGNNVGIRKALELGFSHILLLNNDTEVEAGFLGNMMHQFSHNPKLGILQPLICFLHEKQKIWGAGGKWQKLLGRAITLGDRKNIQSYSPKTEELDWATGCCMLIKREAILEAGLLNEQYFAYFEDVEWSLRIRKQGFEIALVPEARIYHEAGGSSKKKHDEGVLSPRVFYYHVRNQLFLLRSSNSNLSFVGFSYHIVRFTLWMIYFLLRGRFKKLKAVAKGIRDGFSVKLKPAPTWP